MTERWLPVPGFEGRYDVSDQGRLRSWVHPKGPLPYIRDLPMGDQGYPMANLQLHRKTYMRKIHTLVARAFLGDRPTPDAEIRHLNGDKTDNRLTNLAYGTRSENTLDRVRHGEHHCANRTHCPQGHPYDEQNTRIVRPKGRGPFRMCKTCEAQWRRDRKARRAA